MIYILIGLPRSGKSTIIDKLLGHNTKQMYYTFWNYDLPIYYSHLYCNTQMSVLCADDIRLALTGQRYFAPAEPIVHSIKLTMVRAMLARNQNILIDETHSSERSIKELLSITPNVYGRFIDTHPDECKKRAIECGQNDLVDRGVIDSMVGNFRKMDQKYKDMFNIKASWI